MQAILLVAGDLGDPQPGLGGADVHEGLDLESIGLAGEVVRATAPERVVAVTEVAVAGPEKQVHGRAQQAVPGAAQPRQVGAAAALDVARALRIVGAAEQSSHERGDLLGKCRAVGVERHHDVAGRRLPSRDQRVALALPRLLHDPCIRAQGERRLDGAVARVTVDDQKLVFGIEPRQDVRQVLRLVESGNHDTDPRLAPHAAHPAPRQHLRDVSLRLVSRLHRHCIRHKTAPFATPRNPATGPFGASVLRSLDVTRVHPGPPLIVTIPPFGAFSSQHASRSSAELPAGLAEPAAAADTRSGAELSNRPRVRCPCDRLGARPDLGARACPGRGEEPGRHDRSMRVLEEGTPRPEASPTLPLQGLQEGTPGPEAGSALQQQRRRQDDATASGQARP